VRFLEALFFDARFVRAELESIDDLVVLAVEREVHRRWGSGLFSSPGRV
jgi:hypothetical protein